MQVILRKDVDNLGFEFELVQVKNGFARNFLIPRGLAALATPKTKEELEANLKLRATEEATLIKAAEAKNAQLADIKVNVETKVGSGDKLFGSINNADLAAAISAKGLDIEKKNIKIPGNTIKRLGAYVAKIKFHREVEVEYAFNVVADAESKKANEKANKERAAMKIVEDARKKAAAKAAETTSFDEGHDNPLYEKKEEVVEEELVEAEETVAEATEETATEETAAE